MGDVPTVTTAAYITGHGSPDAIRVGELPVPEPGPTDVIVRTEALAVNHVDTFVRSGSYRTHTPFPFVIGRDLVGTVAARGAGVAEFRAGDRVWCNSLGHDGRQGSFARYALVPVERLYRLPDAADPGAAVAVLHTAATAHIGLFREARLRAGETVVVTGAAGGVGSALVQLASFAGAKVVATASGRDAEWCRSLGAHTVIDHHDPRAMDRVGEAVPEGAAIFWDNTGRNDIEAALPVLADGARIIVMSGPGSRPILPVGEIYTRDVSVHGFVISKASVADLRSAAATINALLAADRLHARVGTTLPLTRAADAHRLQETRGPQRPRGRIVVLP
ncbi:NADPH:quinone reductase [Actinoallomurus sp. NBC_01490]|uniref:NADPH:quinone reductase n=1 Tax=Actinoallomurus sp. NBC_01490 TaxID=2903557 RepID=UPI002E35A5B8|nr:NADPH:quinone reductase [Actinoallomurus sp. NBC_01490]